MSDQPEKTYWMDTEPAQVLGALTGLVTCLFAALTVWGISVTPEQEEATQNLLKAAFVVISTLGPIVSGALIRRKVYAPASVAKIDLAAWKDGYTEGHYAGTGEMPPADTQHAPL